MWRIATVYGLIAAFIASERFLRQGEAATSLEEEAADKGTTKGIGTALGAGIVMLLLAPLLNRRHIGKLPGRWRLFPVGVAAMVTGLLLRGWSNRVLGAAYTRTLRVAQDQHIIQDGPYRVVRHPGYLGTLLVWVGAAVALGNGIAVAIVGGLLLRAYARRIQAEERMLVDTFGDEYRRYATRTRRLVPFVY